MAMLPQDKAYWQEKLGWKSLFYLWCATILVGSIILPIILFTLDWSGGRGYQWTSKMVVSQVLDGVMLGTTVSLLMYTAARFYLYMEWLPPRR